MCLIFKTRFITKFFQVINKIKAGKTPEIILGDLQMERLLDIAQLMDRWHCSDQTVKRRLRQMRHMENPLRTWESAAAAWEAGKTVTPGEAAKKPARRVKYDEWVPGMRVPRRRTSA